MTPRQSLLRTAILAAALGLLSACGGGGDAGGSMMSVNADGTSTVNAEALAARLQTYVLAAPLSTAEAASLTYMREEEQLAHDVYAVSAALYGQAIFTNITASEASHSAAVKALLDRYSQPDPLQGLAEGHFKSAEFQALYDRLVAASRLSLIEAIKVGVQIEELDMRDIVAQQAAIDNADILMVYDNLLRGSRNHLRAYMKVLTQQGGSYVPQYISQTEFDAIVQSAVETGN
jgi:hypothetical protein